MSSFNTLGQRFQEQLFDHVQAKLGGDRADADQVFARCEEIAGNAALLEQTRQEMSLAVMRGRVTSPPLPTNAR